MTEKKIRGVQISSEGILRNCDDCSKKFVLEETPSRKYWFCTQCLLDQIAYEIHGPVSLDVGKDGLLNIRAVQRCSECGEAPCSQKKYECLH